MTEPAIGSAFLCPYCLCGIGWVWYSVTKLAEVAG